MSEGEEKKNSLEELRRKINEMNSLSDPNRLHTVSLSELYDTVYKSKPAVIEDFIYPGLCILAGDSKIGKSLLVLQIGFHVATGTELWDKRVTEGAVLYLALEDQYARLQSRMYKIYGTESTDKLHFCCSNSVGDYRGTCGPGRHYVRADAIEQIVSLELNRLSDVLINNEGKFIDILAKKTNKDILAEKKHLDDELQISIARNEKVLKLYEKIFEDNAEGKVPDEMFMALSHKYEVERMELKTKTSEIRKQLCNLEKRQMGIDAFVGAIRKFMQMKTLTAPLLHEFIDHIDVFETEGTGKNKT